jgi:hypothetical protein
VLQIRVVSARWVLRHFMAGMIGSAWHLMPGVVLVLCGLMWCLLALGSQHSMHAKLSMHVSVCWESVAHAHVYVGLLVGGPAVFAGASDLRAVMWFRFWPSLPRLLHFVVCLGAHVVYKSRVLLYVLLLSQCADHMQAGLRLAHDVH